jgi:hypothetical protein
MILKQLPVNLPTTSLCKSLQCLKYRHKWQWDQWPDPHYNSDRLSKTDKTPHTEQFLGKTGLNIVTDYWCGDWRWYQSMFHWAVKSLSQAQCRQMENFLQIPERDLHYRCGNKKICRTYTSHSVKKKKIVRLWSTNCTTNTAIFS